MDDRDADFAEYVGERSAALRRCAFLLTGDLASADDLLQDALVKVYRRWPPVTGPGTDAYVRTVIARTHISVWRRVGRREVPVAELLDVADSRESSMASPIGTRSGDCCVTWAPGNEPSSC